MMKNIFNAFTCNSLDYCADHYITQIQVPEQLKTSLLKCLCEKPQLGNISAICAFEVKYY